MIEVYFSGQQQQRRALMESIFREHYTEVHTFISNRVRQPEVADDLTSTVFLKAFRWLLEDHGVQQVRRWLYTTARTTLADYWQEQLTHRLLPLEAGADLAIAFEPRTHEHTQQQLHHLLSILPAREREVLLLRYLRGYTASEVGQELGLSASHVRVLQLRALRQASLFARTERKKESMKQHILTYTEQGQCVLDLAKAEAQALRHYYIGTEHLLLGILAEGSAATQLLEQGTTPEHVRAGLLFLVGTDQGDPAAGTPFTPQARTVLEQAQQHAREKGDAAINPQHILYALERSDSDFGLTAGILQSLGLNLSSEDKPAISVSSNKSALELQESLIALYPALDSEDERQLAHSVVRGEREKKRASYYHENPDEHVVEEGRQAYFRLFMANQQLVLSVAREYMAPGRDVARLLEAGNKGLSYAIHKFGLKTQVPFRSYAVHWIHLEIIESVLV